jgi:hypothetical protein
MRSRAELIVLPKYSTSRTRTVAASSPVPAAMIAISVTWGAIGTGFATAGSMTVRSPSGSTVPDVSLAIRFSASEFAMAAAISGSPCSARMSRSRVVSLGMARATMIVSGGSPSAWRVSSSAGALVASSAYVNEIAPAARVTSVSPTTGPTNSRVLPSYVGGTPEAMK